MKFLKAIIISLIALFTISIALPACSSGKSYSKSKVKSSSGMGNKKDKNRHVWGK